ncbi:hypothetical protein BU26DRAFT_566121 [Trematosphaeria pertusa]|uniref:Chorismate mutase n=1 Tax=Trematosphaeria pertusa TaxID=390896 RepID=A0A6A6I976_9PLEO|nr:uncharacterized protein BU26DRAFT_566121 [Trematosphaeria pertusa]KAF2247124.1 hypothetical protein BU26DRAFT_566121 [Trematosphaeria pertusa]
MLSKFILTAALAGSVLADFDIMTKPYPTETITNPGEVASKIAKIDAAICSQHARLAKDSEYQSAMNALAAFAVTRQDVHDGYKLPHDQAF